MNLFILGESQNSNLKTRRLSNKFLCRFQQSESRRRFFFFDIYEITIKFLGLFGFYKGIVPLWCRQVPYTIVKFVAFEEIVEQIYKRVLYKKPKNEYSRGTQLGVTFASGYLAGVFCAIVSHPADTIVSKLNNVKTDSGVTTAIKKIYGDIGFRGLWAGLGARIIMIGTLTGFQWWIYNSFKTAVGLQATGGEATVKKH